jgi:hypothetical protein
MKKIMIISTMLLLLLPHCFASSHKIKELNPKPNIALRNYNQKICLVIDSKILSNFTVPKHNDVDKTKVTDWHKSLINGFINGFEDYFTIVSDPSEADLILKFTRADLEWIPGSYTTTPAVGFSPSYTKVASIISRITFKAQLINKQGDIIKTCANTINGRGESLSKRYVTQNVTNALESMYEYIGKSFF